MTTQELGGLVVLVAGAAGAAVVAVAVWRTFRIAADASPAIAVSVLLAIVTLAALAVYIIEPDAAVLALVGTGVGALAGAVASVYGGPRNGG